jgi:hypothetical protein
LKITGAGERIKQPRALRRRKLEDKVICLFDICVFFIYVLILEVLGQTECSRKPDGGECPERGVSHEQKYNLVHKSLNPVPPVNKDDSSSTVFATKIAVLSRFISGFGKY